MKKISLCVIAIMLVFMSLSGIYAADNLSVFDTKATDVMYKFSDDADITLPYARASQGRIIIDRDVNKSGLSFANENLSVVSNLKGVQTLMSADTIRVEGNLEYGILIAKTVIIEGTVDRSLVIMAENVTIAKDAVIKEDLICSASDLQLYGTIEGNLLGTVGYANISGNISKDFRAHVDGIAFNEESKINGNVYISSYNNDVLTNVKNVYPNATVNIEEEQIQEYKIDIMDILKTAIIFALIYLVLTNSTKLMKDTLNKVKNYKVSTVLLGALSIVIMPLVFLAMIVLAAFGFGVLAVPMAVIYVTFLIVSFMLSTLIVGSVMCEYITTKYADKIKGNWYKLFCAFFEFLCLGLLSSLPVVGGIIAMSICLLASGIVTTALYRKIKE